MVGYGSSLRRARRPGWEDAYLDYDGLNLLLKEMKKRGINELQFHHGIFLTRLRLETEKVSLFALAQQGDLASAVGALRFGETNKNRSEKNVVTMSRSKKSLIFSKSLVTSNDMQPTTNNQDDENDSLTSDDNDGNWVSEGAGLGEQAALLSSNSKRSARNNWSADSSSGSSQHPAQGMETEGTATNTSVPQVLDTYTSLGIELLHLIRFICINAMGIRKILKKHDKILLHVLATTNQNDQHDNDGQDKNYLDWHDDPLILSLSSSSDAPRDIMVWGSSHSGGGGGPDDHFQQLANSASIAAIHASLLAAFLEYQQLDKVSSYQQQDSHEPSPSLIRLECAISSIHTIREFAQLVNQPFSVFLSRKAMIVTGRNDGNLGGLEGTVTQKALQVLLKFQPESILTLDRDDLMDWQTKLVSMQQTSTRSRGVSIDSGAMDLFDDSIAWGGVNAASMVINLMSTLLYTVNYYIVAPTANHYAILLGTDGAFGATLVGASSFAAILAAFLYSVWYTKSSFQSALLFSAVCPCVGNLLYALAISYQSMPIAIWGRILVGFGSAEVVNRQLISACVSFTSMTKASALFVAAGALGMSIGPLLAAILDMISGRDVKVDLEFPGMPAGGVIYNHVTSPGFVMALLWLVEILALVFLFSEPDRINGGGFQKSKNENDSDRLESSIRQDVDSDVESCTYGTVQASHLQSSYNQKGSRGSGKKVWRKWKSSLSQFDDIRKLIFDNMALPVTLLLFAYIELVDEVLISSCSMVCRRYFGWHASRAGFLIASLGALVLPAHFVVERASRFYKERTIMKYSLVFICVSLFAILNYTGFLYDAVGLGVEAIEDIESNNLDEHDAAVDDDATSEPDAGSKAGVISTSIASLSNKENEFSYDWGIGQIVYVTFLSAVFMGTIILEGVDTSIMSKVTPAKLNDTFINSGLLATLVGTLGRVGGDSMITISALVDRSVFTDFVNATFFPMIPIAFLGYYLVKRYYKLLI